MSMGIMLDDNKKLLYFTFNNQLKRQFHQGLFWSRQYPILFLVDRPHFYENSREPASTIEQYPIPSGGGGGDQGRSPQSSEGRVPKKCYASVFKHVKKQ